MAGGWHLDLDCAARAGPDAMPRRDPQPLSTEGQNRELT